MEIKAQISGSLKHIADEEMKTAEAVMKTTLYAFSKSIQANWRGQIRSAKLPQKLANAIQTRHYPEAGTSLRASSLVYSKAPKITDAFERGHVIRGKAGNWLAIALPAAGRAVDGGRISPDEFKKRTGLDLRLVERRGKHPLLVANGRLSKGKRRGGMAKRKGGRRRQDGILSGEMTIPIFVLVPIVKLTKRLNLIAAADRIAGSMASQVVEGWR